MHVDGLDAQINEIIDQVNSTKRTKFTTIFLIPVFDFSFLLERAKVTY